MDFPSPHFVSIEVRLFGGPTSRATCSTRMTNRDHRADVADQPVAPGESHGVVTIGRRSYRRYGTA